MNAEELIRKGLGFLQYIWQLEYSYSTTRIQMNAFDFLYSVIKVSEEFEMMVWKKWHDS